MKKNKRLLIVGGVAGGASCAARARRLSEEMDIIVFERSEFVSFANCGLPYYVGRVIKVEDELLVATPELFRDRFNIEVRTETFVRRVFPALREVEAEDLKTGRRYRESYDALVLAPGSTPLKPTIPGIDLPGVHTLWTIPDSRRIMSWIRDAAVSRAVVVGGGFIGLEMAENLKHLDMDVRIVEMQPQVMPAVDPEIASFIHDHLMSRGITLHLESAVTAFEKNSTAAIVVKLNTGLALETDMVIFAAGVRPRTELAVDAGLTIGEFGGILVDERMQTCDRHIWAVGDAAEVRNVITGRSCMVPLAGPANRQGRIAADSIVGQVPPAHVFRGVQATAVCGILGLTVATTGLNEKSLSGFGELIGPYEKVYLHPDHHAGYYPDAKTLTLKLIFNTKTGRVLGAQAVGEAGVEKRIDVISMAIQRKATVFDLEEAELCYAPQYGSAKDPVNLAGMIAANIMRGYARIDHWENLTDPGTFILDVRDIEEYRQGHLENAVNIPLEDLRECLEELPRDREIWVHCYVGQRSYFAARILRQHGFKVKNISGGYLMYDPVKRYKRNY